MSELDAGHLDQIIANAHGEIDRDLLTETSEGGLISRGYFHDGPLITQLPSDETLQFLVENQSKGLEIEWASETETITPTGKYRTAALITNTATRVVIGHEEGDQIVEIPHRRVTDATADTGLLRDVLELVSTDATYRLPTTKSAQLDDINDFILKQHADATATAMAAEETDERRDGRTENTESEHDTDPPPEEETIADTDGIPVSGYWQLPTVTAVSTLETEPIQHITAARNALSDGPDVTAEQLIRAHSDLCAAVESTSSDHRPPIDAIHEVIDDIETELVARQTTPQGDEGVDPAADAPNAGAGTAASPTSKNDGEAATGDTGQRDADSSPTEPSEDDPEPAPSGSSPAEDQWRARLLRELKRLDATHAAPVDSHLVAAESRYEPVDYDSAFTNFDAALAEAGLDTTDSPDDQPETGEDTEDETGFDFSKTAAAGEDTEAEGISPNELTELYEAFGMLQAVIDQLLPHLDPQTEAASKEWYQAVYEYWSGEGPAEAPSYGEQQRGRNDFSIDDYRDEYGDGNRITEFQVIDTIPIEDATRDDLGDLDLAVEAKGVVPVTPRSGVPLPVLVRTKAELSNALELLAEFPRYPDATAPAPDSTSEQQELPEGRVDEVTVTIVDGYRDTGSKRDAWVSVQTATGQRMPLVIWTTHNIDADLEIGATYTLYDARHKIWTSDDGEQTHELSSTSDLTIEKRTGPTPAGDSASPDRSGTPRASTKEAQTNEPNENSEQEDPPPNNEDESDGEPEDIVDRLLKDLEL